MHIPLKIIHPELRRAGAIFRFMIPYYTPGKFRFVNTLSAPLKGLHSRGMRCEQHYLVRLDGSKLRIRVYSPLTPIANVPGLLWIHGGGFAMGLPEQETGFIRRFVEASGCVVVSPDYTLSVDAPYPAALEDCYTALLWLKEHGAAYGMRSDQIFVGGGSAGGSLTAAVCLYARDKGEVSVAFQMPLYPMLDDRMENPSATNNDAPVWNSASNQAAWRLYLGEYFGRSDVPAYAAPARAGDLTGLPPACSFVGSIDPFRDEAIYFVKRLDESGVPVQFKLFEGCFHWFDFLCGKSAVGQEALNFLMDNFRYAVKHYIKKQP